MSSKGISEISAKDCLQNLSTAPTLILDEPLANLDFGYQTVVAQHLKGLAKAGHTILMTGHDPQFAYHASSRVALLIDGRLE